jgi:DNA polymerase III subunit epsilon
VTFTRRLREWLRPDAEIAGLAGERWVVLDTETSGLDPAKDQLLAIGAVSIDGEGIRLDDSFEVVLHSEPAGDKDNVAIHGIGHEAQSDGIPAAEALGAFTAFVAGAPCAGFHCEFDRIALTSCARTAGVRLTLPRWLDLAPLAAAVVPETYSRGNRSLDDWLTVFDIAVVARHSAAGDALATAELLLRLRALAAAQRIVSFAGLVRLSQQHRWLGAPN